MKPFCFVLMPFGVKTDGNKNEIDFDKVYTSFIKPAIINAGFEPIRADEEKGGGFIHKPMYERLMFCDFAVADLSFANPNVFYELGIRHALKPFTTISIFEINTKLPFDTAALRTYPYNYHEGSVENVESKIKDLTNLIQVNLNTIKAQSDSPIAQLIQKYKFPDLNYLQNDADAFTDWVKSTILSKNKLNELVVQWKQIEKSKEKDASSEDMEHLSEDQQKLVVQIKQIEIDNISVLNYNYDLLYALLNAYKSVNAFNELARMLSPIVETSFKTNIYLKQQLALAYNKIKNREASETILKTITDQYGPDPETNGLLGAVYKGMMDDNKKDELLYREYRKQAIDAYLAGFESDPRDYYPGINALTLIFHSDEPDDRLAKFLPLVSYAVERELKRKSKEYWVQATALELAVLEMNEIKAKQFLAAALVCQPEKWMTKSTATNLKLIYDKFVTLNFTDLKWLQDMINRLK